MDWLKFAFIVFVPVALAGGALVGLLALGALLDAVEHPGAIQRRIEALFRRPPRPPRTPGKKHYYRPYWSPPGSTP
jgi:hypothetical protein